MRTFIGIDFSNELKDEIANLQSVLRTHASSGRWKYIDNFHLTLKFLDEINSGTSAEIGKRLDRICSVSRKFKLEVTGLGNFPGKDCLRVLWLGLGGEFDRLNSLQKDIDMSLQQIGFEREKRGYTPHVTIGQDLVFDLDFERIKELAGEIRFPEIRVEKLYLFKSEQIGRKRVYTPVSEFKLQGE